PVGQEDTRVRSYLMNHMGVMPPDIATNDQILEAQTGARQAYVAMVLLESANRALYGSLLESLRMNYLLHQNGYPRTILAAFSMLQNYIPGAGANGTGNRAQQPQAPAVFLQETDGGNNSERNGSNRGGRGRGNGGNGGRGSSGGQQPQNSQATGSTRSDNTTSSTVAPYSSSPRSTMSETPVAKDPEMVLNQMISSLPRTWIIIDSASSIDLFCNSALLIDLQDAPTPITILSAAGQTAINQFGYLPGYPERIWYQPNGAANVLSLRNLARHFTITFDSDQDPAMLLHVDDYQQLRFCPGDNGLYFYDYGDNSNPLHANNSPSIFTLLTTVNDKKAEYNQRGLEQAKLARRIQNIMMRPPSRRLMELVATRSLSSMPAFSNCFLVVTHC
ncbi:MAG: hypothetical protein ACKO44_10300, partial [Algoriphagus sp.]